MPRVEAQTVILELLRAADGEWTGKTKLFKAFYFAHLFYANESPRLLTGWPIARMPQGPGIHRSHELFRSLVDAGLMEVESIHDGPYPESRYRLTTKGREVEQPPEDVQRAIEKSTLFCLPKTAAELSQLTHEQSRSWLNAKDGDILDVCLDTIPDDEYEKRAAELVELDRQVSAALGRGT